MSDEITFDGEAYSVTLKAGRDFDVPWIVVRAATIEVLHDRVKAVAQSGIMATIGNTSKSFQAAYQLGKVLDAEPMNPPTEPASGKAEAAAKKTSTRKTAAKKAGSKAAEAPAEAPAEKPAEEPAAPAAAAAPKSAAPAAGGRPKPAWKK